MTEPQADHTPRQAIFIKRLTQAKARLLQCLEGLSPLTLSTENVLGNWTAKDLIGHVVSWNEEFRANIAVILQGQHPGYDHQISGENDFSSWNQARIDQKRSWSPERILADFERDYQEAVALIQRLQPEDFQKRGITPWKQAALSPSEPAGKADYDSIELLVSFHWRHMNQHARDLEKWRKRFLGG